MPRERFRETGKGSFYGDVVYDRAVPKDNFLRKLNEVVDWRSFTQKLLRYYKGGGEYGPPPYEPTLILKMLLVSYLYDLSERQVEEYVNDSLSAKHFLGLAVDEAAPDHATLTVFKNRLLARKGEKVFEQLFKRVLSIAKEKGIGFGRIQVVDSVHTIADVNVEKDAGRQKKGQGPRDPNARWGAKGKKPVRDENGKKHEQTEYFFGYKAHVSLNAETGLITSLKVTPGSAYDGHELPDLVKADLSQGVGAKVYAGDKGYDDGDNHEFLWQHGLKSALRLKTTRTKKKDPNKGPWLKLVADPDYEAGLKERYKVERKFGEAKLCHGFRRCRYLGLARYRVQSYLTAMALNLKRMVKLLHGVSFRNQGDIVPRAA
jgi:IS5 family transposase